MGLDSSLYPAIPHYAVYSGAFYMIIKITLLQVTRTSLHSKVTLISTITDRNQASPLREGCSQQDWEQPSVLRSISIITTVIVSLRRRGGSSSSWLVREGECVFAGVFVWAFAGLAVATPSSLSLRAGNIFGGQVEVRPEIISLKVLTQ